MKTAISLPDPLFRSAERAAHRLRMSRSRFFAAAALYRATGLAKYNDYVVAHYTDAEYAMPAAEAAE